MLCDIYASKKREEMYLYVARGQRLDELPAALLALFGAARHVTTLNIDADKKLARANAGKVLAQIEAELFYLHMPPNRYSQATDQFLGGELDGPAS